MGHYASEMCCPKCGGVGGGVNACKCPVTRTPPSDYEKHFKAVMRGWMRAIKDRKK